MAKMKRSEKVLWAAVALALAANIWLPRQMRYRYSWEKDLSQRLATEFSATREDVKEYVSRYIPDVTDGQIDAWTASGKLESMQIGKRTMYFREAAANLFRIDPELAAVKADAGKEDSCARTVASCDENSRLALKKKMRVTFTITVPANTLRPGNTVRCWLPFPRQDIGRQMDVKLIEAGADGTAYPENSLTFSDPSCPHSSVYLEAKVRRNRPTVFHEVFEYASSGEWHPSDSSEVSAYDKESGDYRKYTSELDRHVIFTDRIRHLADSVTAGITSPYIQAREIRSWILAAFPWTAARDYSTIENIPEYVLSAGHGDCGQVTLLFITMCRYKGIPARWQSGWTMLPGNVAPHDWCEVYFEGCGWMPVDLSPEAAGDFYFGGIDPYRLVLNSDLGDGLSPAKKFPRSDLVDFRRGEVEWDKGNLYSSQWTCDIKVEYI